MPLGIGHSFSESIGVATPPVACSRSTACTSRNGNKMRLRSLIGHNRSLASVRFGATPGSSELSRLRFRSKGGTTS